MASLVPADVTALAGTVAASPLMLVVSVTVVLAVVRSVACAAAAVVAIVADPAPCYLPAARAHAASVVVLAAANVMAYLRGEGC